MPGEPWPPGAESAGVDRRFIYTKDLDARAGHRSANNQRDAGMYVGYELHLSVQIPDYSYGGRPDQVTFSEPVPNFITAARLTPAGANRAQAAVPMLLAERVAQPGVATTPDARGHRLSGVEWDRGYSLQAYASAHGTLWQAGIEPVFDLTSHQRKQTPVLADIDWIDGAPFSKHTPAHLRDLPRESRDTTPE
jgi:hypothetical protein